MEEDIGGRGWGITQEKDRTRERGETKRKSDIWKDLGTESDVLFLFSSSLWTRCGIAEGPLSSCLHLFSNLPGSLSPSLWPRELIGLWVQRCSRRRPGVKTEAMQASQEMEECANVRMQHCTNTAYWSWLLSQRFKVTEVCDYILVFFTCYWVPLQERR